LAEGLGIPFVAYVLSTLITVFLHFYEVVSIRTNTAISSIVLIIVTYILLRKSVGAPWRCVGLRGVRPRLIVYSVLASFAIIVPAMSLEAVVLSRFKIPEEWMEFVLKIVSAENVPQLIYAWLVAAVGAALSEELVFRGVLQNSLASRMRGWLAVLITSSVFAVLHTWRFPAAFVLGFFLGVLYLRTGSLVPSIVAHLTINSVAVFGQFAVDHMGEGVLPPWVREEETAPVVLLGISVAVFGVLMSLLLRETVPGAGESASVRSALGVRRPRMTSRERVSIVLKGGIPDRVPLHDGYWDEALERWKGEGLPESVASDKEDSVGEYFDTEIRLIRIDDSFLFEERVIDEDERYITKLTKNGSVMKYIKGRTSTPGLLSFAVGSRARWEELRERLVSVEGRLPGDLERLYRSYRENNRFVTVCVHDPYEGSWSKLGPTYLLEAMKTEPELVHDVFRTMADLNIAVCEHLFAQGYEVDGAWIWGDIAYSKGTLFSPQTYTEVLYPYHKRLIGFFAGRGLPVVYHSDGDLRRVIPHLIEAGIRCLQPLEAKANMDLFELKREYGDKLVFMGNVDFERVAMGARQAEEEIRNKVGLGKEGGGYIYHSDHSVPPTISLAHYRHALDMVRHYGRY
jgi:uroporphyrinogen decarboxylase